ncbi:E3 SUMO-protein ligase nse2 [Pseudocercospora fuligena]|uniref:E3 SUMO-protein ligase nse2 n=1 Tax=Pseudocercospora fuligena TaxID=685502 RepID=A0A8H6RI47_9PEZI|nr:E3 SUMO-protein ligase nse2 [Pseudocercospora fuligena]
MSARVRHSTATPGPSSRGAPASTSTAMPDYQSPAFPLSPAAQRALSSLLQKHSTRRFEEHINSAQTELSTVVGDIYDALNTKRQATTKRRQRFDDGREDDEDGLKTREAQLDRLQEKAKQMHERMEEQMRKLVDAKAGVESMREAVGAAERDARENATTQASTQQGRALRNRRVDRDEDDEDDNEDEEMPDFTPTDPAGGTQPPTAPKDAFKKHLETSQLRWQGQSLTDRYASNKEYADFKRVLHDGLYPDDDVELAPPDRWFDEGGRPAPGTTTRTQNEDDSDDDIAVERTTISTRCPLTLRELDTPWTSKKCPHTFEKDAIMNMINGSTLTNAQRQKYVQCPCGGCQQQLTKNDVGKDPVMTRKIKRIQAARRAAEEEEDGEEDEPDGTQRRGHIIDSDALDIDETDRAPPVRMKTEQNLPG